MKSREHTIRLFRQVERSTTRVKPLVEEHKIRPGSPVTIPQGLPLAPAPRNFFVRSLNARVESRHNWISASPRLQSWQGRGWGLYSLFGPLCSHTRPTHLLLKIHARFFLRSRVEASSVHWYIKLGVFSGLQMSRKERAKWSAVVNTTKRVLSWHRHKVYKMIAFWSQLSLLSLL